MKKHSLLVCHHRLPALMAFLAAVVIGCSVNAQNLLNNPGFESPLSSNDWTVVYVNCGPSDFFPADRTTAKRKSGTYAAHVRVAHDGLAHAYLTQTVSGLNPGTNYVISGWMSWGGNGNQAAGKYDVQMEAIGGHGTTNSPSASAEWGPLGDDSYHQYFITQTADFTGKIEVRLHMDRYATTLCCDHEFTLNGFFDDISLTVQ